MGLSNFEVTVYFNEAEVNALRSGINCRQGNLITFLQQPIREEEQAGNGPHYNTTKQVQLHLNLSKEYCGLCSVFMIKACPSYKPLELLLDTLVHSSIMGQSLMCVILLYFRHMAFPNLIGSGACLYKKKKKKMFIINLH